MNVILGITIFMYLLIMSICAGFQMLDEGLELYDMLAISIPTFILAVAFVLTNEW